MNENMKTTTTTVPNLTALASEMGRLIKVQHLNIEALRARLAEAKAAGAGQVRAAQDLEMAQDEQAFAFLLTNTRSALNDGLATKLELVAAHNLVVNQADRRGPIDAVIAPSLKRIVQEAINFFDATPADFSPTTGPNGDEALRVTSIGYRAGPAGDH